MTITVPRSLLLACALLVAAPATAGAAQRTSVPATPRVKSVAPLSLRIGDRLTVRGTGFIKGKNRNTVVFKADGRRAVFAKADIATSKMLVVTVPAKLAPFLKVSAGAPAATRFRLRVLARRLSNAYTPVKGSPTIAPASAAPVAAMAPAVAPAAAVPAAAAPVAPVVIPEPDFDADGIPDATDPDDDNDLLPDATELVVGTNQYSADTDGDGVSDGFEYESAYDLNGRPMWSYPAKLPYPNGRDASDVNFDFDGDGMTLIEEYQLWKHTGGKLPLTYSDGDQDSTGTASTADTTPVGSVPNGLALDRLQPNGTLTDDEKDADADGLTNWEETHGPMLISWWGKRYATELQFAGSVGAAPLYETSFVSQDSDGDGNADGTDDQDHDGWSNLDELSRTVSGFWVHVYNPCLPNPDSRTCTLHPPFDDSWAPFGSNAVAGDQADKLVWPR